MTRRLCERSHRRLARVRPAAHRTEHGLDLALVPRRESPQDQADRPGRADQHALRTLAEENATLARELGRAQARCTQWRDDCIGRAQRLEALLMRTRAECIVKVTQLAALGETLDALNKRAAVWLTNEELLRRIGDLRARNRTLEAELVETRRSLAEPVPTDRAPAIDLPALAILAPLAQRRVLCVGARARQVPVYRALVERGGGHFAHVDGADAAGPQELRRLLGDADLVILQAGYVCQRACQAVESHCALTGVQCVRLDKPCVLGFARSLAGAVAAA